MVPRPENDLHMVGFAYRTVSSQEDKQLYVWTYGQMIKQMMIINSHVRLPEGFAFW